MNDKKLKHLEFIQNIITRMNTNSFVIKGWSVTLVSALFALAAAKSNLWFVIIAYLPVMIFWGLDGFFISTEKQYRELYREVAKKDESTIDFNLDATEYKPQIGGWLRNAFTNTLWPFHAALLFVVGLVMFGMIIRIVLCFAGCSYD